MEKDDQRNTSSWIASKTRELTHKAMRDTRRKEDLGEKPTSADANAATKADLAKEKQRVADLEKQLKEQAANTSTSTHTCLICGKTSDARIVLRTHAIAT